MRPPAAIEPLEARIAPASLIDARTVAFTDVDGDEVKIVFSKDVFTGGNALALARANQVLKFNVGDVSDETATLQQLQLIDFTKFPTFLGGGSTVNGIGVTITATQKDGGDGLADVGLIKAAGISLGRIVIDGDLGKITAGGTSLKIGVASLTVDSFGKRGTATQIPVLIPTTENPAPDLLSKITGELTALKVLGDFQDARLSVVNGVIGSTITSVAKIGGITIGGSLIGRAAVEAASDDTGVIQSDRAIGTVKIGTDAADGIVGGGGANSGRITAGTGITSVTISGGIAGGAGLNSGMINATGSIGTVVLGGDLAGGAGESSGLIRTFGNLTSLTIGDDIVAGTGAGSGFVSVLGSISNLLVKGDIDGTTAMSGAGSAGVFANALPLVKINGSVLGGAGAGSAVIESGRTIGATDPLTALTTGITVVGNVVGGAGDGSGAILADGAIKLATIRGALTGGAGAQSGVLRSGMDTLQTGTMNVVSVQGGVLGGGGDSSGAIISGGNIVTLKLGKLTAPTADVLVGGAGLFSGSISARGKITTVTITGDVLGGDGEKSGSLWSFERTAPTGELPGSIGTVAISGSFTGGSGANSGFIHADGAITSLRAASWTGGTGEGSASLVAGAGLFGLGNVGSIRILGDLAQAEITPGLGSVDFLIDGKLNSLFVGDDTTGATLRVVEGVTKLNFIGDVIGGKVTAGTALASLTVGGSVTDTSFLAGYDTNGIADNPDARIGAVIVRGNWTASNLVAGVDAGTDADFGTADDVKAAGDDDALIVSRIASVIINGTVTGEPSQNFGFVAQHVAKMRVGTTIFALNALADGQTFEVGGAGSGVAIREVPLV